MAGETVLSKNSKRVGTVYRTSNPRDAGVGHAVTSVLVYFCVCPCMGGIRQGSYECNAVLVVTTSALVWNLCVFLRKRGHGVQGSDSPPLPGLEAKY